MRIVSWSYGADFPYEGVSLVLEQRLDDDEWERRREKNPDDPLLDYVDIYAYGPLVPKGRMMVGTYSDYDCAQMALDMVSDAFADGMTVIEMPTKMTIDKTMERLEAERK